ncbi:MAG TPA: F0F1 ATP synthase subunit delta, partial [Bacteroidota bacterium]|nr:F0F1 ATP synthase subunit delta [Bacteroidota bacterium]
MKKTSRQIRRDAKRLFHACLVDGLLDEARARQVVKRVIDARHRGGLALLSHFERLVKLDRAQHTARVESAIPLPADVRARIQAGLDRAYGPGISASFAHTPALIGGMRIRIGSDVYDGSVRARL